LLMVFLGVLATGMAQQVVTTTTTTVITIPGKTYVTTFQGGESTITLIVPEYTMIIVEKYPDQACRLVVKPIQAGGVMTIPGTTFTIPGTTMQTVITDPTMKHSTVYQEDGVTTTTGFTYLEFVTTVAGQTFSLPMPIYAEFISECQTIQVTEEVTITMGSVPATFYYEYPEMTYSFEGTTITMEEMEEVPLTTITTTDTRPGTTYTETTMFPGTTIATVVSLPSGATTISEPERIVTSTITYVTTIEGSPVTTPTQPSTTTTITTTPGTTVLTTPTPTKTETTPPTIQPAGLPIEIIIEIIAVAAVIVVVVAVLVFRRSQSRF